MIPTLVIDAVAAYRLTRLATADAITEDLRGSIVTASYAWNGDEDQLAMQREANPFSTWADLVGMDPEPPKMAKLVTCRWCAGWWISVAVIVMRRRWPRQWAPVADVAACSAAAALIAGLEQ